VGEDCILRVSHLGNGDGTNEFELVGLSLSSLSGPLHLPNSFCHLNRDQFLLP
jgi:hypothetical protein